MAVKQDTDSPVNDEKALYVNERHESEPLIEKDYEIVVPPLDTRAKTIVNYVTQSVEHSDNPIAIEDNGLLSRDDGTLKKGKEVYSENRARLPTPPPPTKNVSFSELNEQSYLDQTILSPPARFVPKHRHTGINIMN